MIGLSLENKIDYILRKCKTAIRIAPHELSLYGILAIFLYLALVFIKVVSGKRIVFCGVINCRIGHLAANTELFLRRLRSGKYFQKNNIYIGICRYPLVSNRQLLTMFKRHLFIIEYNYFIDKMLSTWLRYTEFYYGLTFLNEFYEFSNYEPILSFTEEEEKDGKQLLAEMGIKGADWFVCFHSRDNEYLAASSESHNYRNCSIGNYLKAAEYIAAQGGYAVRMGAVVEKPLPKERDPRIIDYALDYRSDFMDIYLSAKCKFFLGNTAGLHCVPIVFNVPVAGANFSHLELPPVGKNNIFIPKKIMNVKRRGLLTFSVILNSGIGGWLGPESDNYKNNGLELIENTPEEILDLTMEMDQSLSNGFCYSEEDNKLQCAYRALIKPSHRCYEFKGRIGMEFLRKNRELLN
jgi:putative glycosyltransferase (TIGR04372 family)